MRRAVILGTIVISAAAWSAALVAQGAKPPQPPRRRATGSAAPRRPTRSRSSTSTSPPTAPACPRAAAPSAEGAAIYTAKCASCHGKSGEGASFDRLVATDAGENFAFGRDPRLARAIGNYWPYASTLYDYTARSMPFAAPGTLTANEVYGLVAYLLSLNKVVPEDAVMDRTTLPKVVMPARDRFVRDNRTGGKVVK